MGKEIERKFLVANDCWKNHIERKYNFLQAYISHRREGIVRLRICDNKAYLTIKGITIGIERHEWEYEIPITDALEMLHNNICEGDYLEKTRYIVKYEGYTWEIDEFHGKLEGLVLAEIELNCSQDCPPLPLFIGEEVSGNPKYFNSVLNKSQTF